MVDLVAMPATAPKKTLWVPMIVISVTWQSKLMRAASRTGAPVTRDDQVPGCKPLLTLEPGFPEKQRAMLSWPLASRFTEKRPLARMGSIALKAL